MVRENRMDVEKSIERLNAYTKTHLGQGELVDILGITRPAIVRRRRRGGDSFPPPDLRLGSNTLLWKVETIQDWLQAAWLRIRG